MMQKKHKNSYKLLQKLSSHQPPTRVHRHFQFTYLFIDILQFKIGLQTGGKEKKEAYKLKEQKHNGYRQMMPTFKS